MNQEIKKLLESAVVDNDLVNVALYRTGGYDTDKYCFVNREKYNQVLALLKSPKPRENK